MKKTMARIFLVAVIITSLFFISSNPGAEEIKTADPNILEVNGTIITQSDFDREMSQYQQRLAAGGRTPDAQQVQALKKQVMEGIIARELLHQQSEKLGIKIEEKAVKEQLDAIKKQFPKNEDFTQSLAKVGLTENKLTSQIKKEMAIKELIDKELMEKIVVEGKDSKKFYDENPDLFIRPAQVKASHILIKVDPGADDTQKETAKNKIKGIQARLSGGEDFAGLAKTSSQCPSSAKGGDLGYFGPGQMVKPFEEATLAMTPGSVSDIVETQFGYHLIKVTDKRPEKPMSYEEAREGLEKQMKQQKFQQQIVLYVEDLKKDAKIVNHTSNTP